MITIPIDLFLRLLKFLEELKFKPENFDLEEGSIIVQELILLARHLQSDK